MTSWTPELKGYVHAALAAQVRRDVTRPGSISQALKEEVGALLDWLLWSEDVTSRPESSPDAPCAAVPQPEIAPLVLDRSEAAAALGVSIATFDRARKRGEIHTTNVGRRVITTRAAIEEYLQRKEAP
jgi:hypothetical protein